MFLTFRPLVIGGYHTDYTVTNEYDEVLYTLKFEPVHMGFAYAYSLIYKDGHELFLEKRQG